MFQFPPALSQLKQGDPMSDEIFTAHAMMFVSKEYCSVYIHEGILIKIQFYVYYTRFSELSFLGIFLASLSSL